MKKRILSFLLAAIMVFSLLPVTAFASETPAVPEQYRGKWVCDNGDTVEVWAQSCTYTHEGQSQDMYVVRFEGERFLFSPYEGTGGLAFNPGTGEVEIVPYGGGTFTRPEPAERKEIYVGVATDLTDSVSVVYYAGGSELAQFEVTDTGTTMKATIDGLAEQTFKVCSVQLPAGATNYTAKVGGKVCGEEKLPIEQGKILLVWFGTWVYEWYHNTTVDFAGSGPAETHVHKNASGEAVTFQPWTKTNCLPTAAGNYYLTCDVRLDITGGWSFCGDINLCLNGHVIDLGDFGNIDIGNVNVVGATHFGLYDCGTATHKFKTTVMPWVPDEENGDTTLTGGVITGCFAGDGNDLGAIATSTNSIVDIYGGNIVGNVTEGVGGILVSGTLNMYGGNIVGNCGTGDYAGGIQNSGTMVMTGGTIQKNSGYGIENNGSLTVGGNALVTDNLKDSVPCNVKKLDWDDVSMTLGLPLPGMYIGLLNGEVTNATTEADLAYFFADRDDCYLKYTAEDGGKIVVEEIPTGWYKINRAPSENGTVCAPQIGESGSEITLTVVPADGYKLKSLSVADADGDIEINDNKFTMRSKPVTVTAEFMVAGPDYFSVTNTGTGDATLKWAKSGSPTLPTLWYSTDGVNFNDMTIGTTAIPLAQGNTVYFKGNYTGAEFSSSSYIRLSCTGTGAALKLGGDLTTLLDGKGNVSSLAGYTDYLFKGLFNNLTALTDASALKLPSVTLKDYCYRDMFYGCKSLENAPALPATALAVSCYYQMFYDCESLANVPALSATKLAESCCQSMFSRCSALVNAPALPATKLAADCYKYMFSQCSALVNAPALPATDLAASCYYGMFSQCSALVNAPALPATDLAASCYYEMFYICKSLKNAPALPATELASECYNSMFYGCESLENAPVLPAMKLTDKCYYSMFNGCKSLKNAPALPATALAASCYYQMFYNCDLLVSAPALPATALASDCYCKMFRNCKALNSLTVGFTAFNPTNATSDWLMGVAETGTIYLPFGFDASTYATRGASTIPEGWNVDIEIAWYIDETGERAEPETVPTIAENKTGDVNWSGWVYVPAGGKITINGAVTLSNDVNLILADGAELEITKGITSDSKTLTVYGQTLGTGKLTTSMTVAAIAYGVNGNLTVNGGNVALSADGSGNKNSYGVNGSVTVNGGKVKIEGLAALRNGYGVNGSVTVNGGEAEIKGQTNSGSEAYGVNGNVTVTDGKVTITGIGDQGTRCGVSGGTITVSGGELTLNGSTKAFNGTNDKINAKVQTSADGGTYADWDEKTALNTFKYLKLTAPHTHDFTYSADGAVLTATCGSGCTAGYDTTPLSITLTGDVAANAAAVKTWTDAGAAEPTIKYYAASDTEFATPLDAPTTSGKYVVKASVTYGDTPTTVTAELEFDFVAHSHTDAAGQEVIFQPWDKTDSLPTEGSWYLTDNVTLTDWYKLTKNVNLCLNGYQINANGQVIDIGSEDDSGDLTLWDCNSTKQTHTVNRYKYEWDAYGFVPAGEATIVGGLITNGNVQVNKGSFTMNGGAISGTKSGSNSNVIVEEGSSFTMNGGEISYNASRYAAVSAGGDCTFTGGKIVNNIIDEQSAVSIWTTLTLGGTTVIKDNTNEYGEPADLANFGTISISETCPPAKGMNVGLNADCYPSEVCNAVSGQEKFFFSDNSMYKVIFDSADSKVKLQERTKAWYVDENGEEFELEDGEYTNVEGSWSQDPVTWRGTMYVDKWGSTSINGPVTLDGDVILILADGASLEITGGITGGDKTLTVYGQTFGTGKLTALREVTAGSDFIQCVIGNVVINGGDVKISGKGFAGNAYGVAGAVTVNGGKAEISGSSSYGSGYGIYSSVTVNGGEVKISGNGGDGVNSSVTVTGGKAEISGSGNGVVKDVVVSGGSLKISGASAFGGYNISVTGTGEVALYGSTKAVSKANNNVTVNASVKTSSDGVNYTDWDGQTELKDYKYLKLTKIPYQAEIAGEPVQQFMTLKEAVEAAEDGATITLLSDVTLDEKLVLEENITLDLNGKKLTTTKELYADGENKTITVKNGKIDGSLTNGNLVMAAFGQFAKSKLIVEDVEFVGAQEQALINCGAEMQLNNVKSATGNINSKTGKLNISGGSFAFVEVSGGTAALSGTEDKPLTVTKLTAPSGVVTKSGKVTATIPAGYGWDKDSKLIKAEAEIDGVAYPTLAEALAAAADGKTVKLIDKIKLTGQIEISKKITLDGNGFEIDGSKVKGAGAILVNGAAATVKNLTVSGPNTTASGWDSGEFGIKFYHADGATLDGVTVKNANAGIQVNGGSVTMKNSITVSGNEFGGIELCKGGTLDLTDATLVNDGETDANPVLWNDDTKGTITFSGSQALYVKAADANKDHYYLDGEAKIGTTNYRNLTDAVAAAKDGETVTLLKDYSGAGFFIAPDKFTTSGLTIDFNNKTYTCSGPAVGSTGTESQAFHIEKGNKVTLKNGTVTSTADSGVKMLVQNYCDLTLNGMTLNGTNLPDTGRYVLSNNCGNTVIENTTITAKEGDFALDTCKYGSYALPSVEVKGTSAINGNVELSGGNLKLTAGTLTGSLVATGIGDGIITKTSGFTAAAPTGYKWVNNAASTEAALKFIVTINATAEDFTYGDGKTGYKELSVGNSLVAADDLVKTYYKETTAGAYETTGTTTVPTNVGNYKVVISVADSDTKYTGSKELTFTISKFKTSLGSLVNTANFDNNRHGITFTPTTPEGVNDLQQSDFTVKYYKVDMDTDVITPLTKEPANLGRYIYVVTLNSGHDNYTLGSENLFSGTPTSEAAVANKVNAGIFTIGVPSLPTQQKPISFEKGLVNALVTDTGVTNALTNENTSTLSATTTYSSSNTSVATVDATTGAVTIVAAGSTTITATSHVANPDVTDVYASYTLNVTKQAVTVTVKDMDIIYGGANPYEGYSNISDVLKFSETIDTTGITPTFTTSYAPGKSVGQYNVSVTLPESAEYSFTYVPGTLTVDQKELKVSDFTVSAEDKDYDGSNIASVKVTAIGNLYSGDAITATAIGTFADANVGTGKTVSYEITGITGAKAGNYKLTGQMTGNDITADIDAMPVTFTVGSTEFYYDGTAKTVAITAKDAKNNSFTAFTVTYGGAASKTAVGNYDIAVTLTDNNYTMANTAAVTGKQLKISKMPISFTFGASEFGYDGGKKTVQVSAADKDNRVFTDYTVKYKSATYAESTTAPTDVGTYTVTAVYDTGKYECTSNTTTLTITAGDAVVWASAGLSHKFDGQPKAVTAMSAQNGLALNVTYYAVDNSANTVGELVEAPANIGRYLYVITLDNNNNYVISNPLDTTNIVGKAISELSGSNFGYMTIENSVQPGLVVDQFMIEKTYGDEPFTPTVSGGANDAKFAYEIVSGDEFIDVDENGEVTIVKPGTAVVKVTASATGYENTTAQYAVRVEKKPLAITLKDSVVYTGEPITSHYEVTGEVDGTPFDASSIAFNYQNLDSAAENPHVFRNVGTYYVTAEIPSDNAYYCSVSTAAKNISITKADLTVTADNKTVTYGDAAPTYTVSYTPLGDDVVGCLGGTAAYACEYDQFDDVGTYAISVTGLTSPNYDITFADGTLTVNPKPVTLNWSNNSFTYDGKEHSVTATVANAVNSDTVTVTAYTNNAKTAADSYSAEATALSNANYTLTGGTDTTKAWTIAQKSVNVKPANVSVYVNGTAELKLDVSALLAADREYTGTPSFTLTDKDGQSIAPTDAVKTAGTYTITWTNPGSVTFNANYDVTKTETATLTVSQYSGGGSTGGGSTGGTTVPVSGDGGSIEVKVTISNGNAELENVSSEELEKIGTGKKVTLDLSDVKKDVSGIIIPKTTIENITASDADGLEVKFPNGTVVSFDKTTVSAIAEQAAGEDIQLVVDRDSKAEQSMTAAQKETLKALNKPVVLDAYFVSGGKRISDFKGGEAELTAVYPTEKPVRVWYVKDDGTKELVPSTFSGKAATFVVKHFSHYVIEELDVADYTTCPQDATCVYAKFTDADTKAWYHDGVHFCVENGYMQGVSATAFDPAGTTTRAMIVTMLWRMEGKPVANYAMSFKDVKADQWYTEAIRWAQSTGVVEGYSAEAFGPDDPITREQMATILYRYAKYHEIDVANTNTLACFTDVNKVSSWALDAMKWANAVGLVQGRTTTTLVPEVSITRAEAATMVQRYCEKVSDK